MKRIIYFIVQIIINNKVLWKASFPIIKYSDLLKREYNKNQIERKTKIIFNKIFDNKLIVINGPFKGMKYPYFKPYGIATLPTLLGSYEKEIQFIMDIIIKNGYQNILDIGCAEGYYAVGLANCTNATVFAYDINEDARKFCHSMAILNHVEGRLHIGNYCDENILKNFYFGSKSLIIADCEGFEKELFTSNNISYLTNCDLLIEIHDNFDITISNYIRELFKISHNLLTIKSIDDIEKIKTYNYSELADTDFFTKKMILSEGRPFIMEWYWLTSKNI